MTYKLVIARFQHETNTFSPVATPLTSFNAKFGIDAYNSQVGSEMPMGAYLQIAEELRATIVTPFAGEADPSDRVTSEAFEVACDSITAAVAQGCDGVMLELHGAMVAEGAEDGEGELLARVRAVAPNAPICVSLDMHANVSQRMVESADIIVGYKTYPHVDYHETGMHAGRLLQRALAGEIRPVVRWCQLPILAHTLAMSTDRGAMRQAVKAAVNAESEPGVLAVSVFGGFPLADVRDAGMSVVVTTDGDPILAQSIADRIAQSIWNERSAFVYRSPPLAQSLAAAQQLAARPGHGPVLLFDHSDNCYSGGSCDTMDVLQAALTAGLTGIATSPICDPEAVHQLLAVGLGGMTTVQLGNKSSFHNLGLSKSPMSLTGRVTAISDGDVWIKRGDFAPMLQRLGRSVVFDVGAAEIIVSEQRVEPYGLEVFNSLGLTPSGKRYLLIKSRMHCRPIFMPIARGLVECDADDGGPTSSNLGLFPIRSMRRPLYPLDPDCVWQPRDTQTPETLAA